MLVRCPKCAKKLKVQDEKVGGAGMKFRCPACSGIFLVKKPATVPPPPPEPETPTRPEPPEQDRAREDSGSILSGFGDSSSDEDAPEEDQSEASRLENPLSGWGHDPVPGPGGASGPEFRPGSFELDPPMEPQGTSDSVHESFGSEDTTSLESSIPGNGGAGPPNEEPMPEETGQPAEDTSSQEIQRAQRLARTIMSDIALYHMRMVEDSIRNDTFFDVMGDEIREGMKLYNSRISPEIRATSDFYREAVENFYQRRRAELAGL